VPSISLQPDSRTWIPQILRASHVLTEAGLQERADRSARRVAGAHSKPGCRSRVLRSSSTLCIRHEAGRALAAARATRRTELIEYGPRARVRRPRLGVKPIFRSARERRLPARIRLAAGEATDRRCAYQTKDDRLSGADKPGSRRLASSAEDAVYSSWATGPIVRRASTRCMSKL